MKFLPSLYSALQQMILNGEAVDPSSVEVQIPSRSRLGRFAPSFLSRSCKDLNALILENEAGKIKVCNDQGMMEDEKKKKKKRRIGIGIGIGIGIAAKTTSTTA